MIKYHNFPLIAKGKQAKSFLKTVHLSFLKHPIRPVTKSIWTGLSLFLIKLLYQVFKMWKYLFKGNSTLWRVENIATSSDPVTVTYQLALTLLPQFELLKRSLRFAHFLQLCTQAC